MSKPLEITSCRDATEHVLLPLTNFSLEKGEPQFWKYDYCYVHFSNELLEVIRQMRKCLQTDMKNHEWQYVPIKDPITLLTESAVFLPKYADFKGFEFVKLDSISFIAAKPLFDGLDTQIAKAHVICKNEEFKITAERSTDGSNYPNLLYHSPPIAYSKMGDMLGCEGMLIS